MTIFFYPGDAILGNFIAFLVGRIFLLPIALAFKFIFIRVLKVPLSILLAAFGVLVIIFNYLVQRDIIDIWQMFFFGLMGCGMRKTGFLFIPLVVGFVLGLIFEVNLPRTTVVSCGDFFCLYFWVTYGFRITCFSFILATSPLVMELYKRWRNRQSEETRYIN